MVKPTPRQEWALRHTFIDFQQTSEILKDPLILERAEEAFHLRSVAFDLDIDAGGRVAYPAGQAVRQRLAINERAKSHPLDHTPDMDTQCMPGVHA